MLVAVYGLTGMLATVVGCAKTMLNAVGCIWVRWNDAGGCIWTDWYAVSCIWARWNHATLGLDLQQKLQESIAAEAAGISRTLLLV